ncbi:MAG: hypothetical protein U1E42_00925 [Rhodospirillales bacterium]
MTPAPTMVGLTAVIVAVTEEVPRVLVVERPLDNPRDAVSVATGAEDGQSLQGLPAGPFEPDVHASLDRGLRSWVKEQTGMQLRYVEQLYTFGNRYRDPGEIRGGPRLLTVAYLALTHECCVAGFGGAQWRDCYQFLPWEDWRAGRPQIVDVALEPGLQRWIRASRDPDIRRLREERVTLCFGPLSAHRRDPVLALERYEVLYEAGLVAEAHRDRASRLAATGAAAVDCPAPLISEESSLLGLSMACDDRRIVATALARLRGKLAYRPLVFELLAEEFTLFQLQQVVEALAGMRLHKQNFRRMIMHAALVEATGRTQPTARGRPAELYRFSRDVMRTRSGVGLGLPTIRASE